MSKWKKVTPNQASKWVNPFGTRIREQITSQLSIPPFVQAAIDFIVAHGLKEEGIFRISANLSSVNKMKAKIASGEKRTFSKPGDDPYDGNEKFDLSNNFAVACLLKLYFRELVDPVCTFEFYDCFIASQGIPEEYRLAALSKVITLLPLPNQLLLMRLAEFCSKIVEHKDINKMGFDNLAVCFAPNLIRTQSVSVELVLSDAGRANNAIRLIFSNGDIIFQKTRIRLERMQIGNKEEKQKAEEEKRRSHIEFQEEPDYQGKESNEYDYSQTNGNYNESNIQYEYNQYQNEYQTEGYQYSNEQYPNEEYQYSTEEYKIETNEEQKNEIYSQENQSTLNSNGYPIGELGEIPLPPVDNAQEESPSLILASVDPRLADILSKEKQDLDQRSSGEDDPSKSAEFASSLKHRYTMFVQNNVKKMKKEKTRSMALGQLDAYEQKIATEICQALVGVDSNDLKQGTWESNEYEKLYNKTIATLKNFSE